ncbi:putative beta-barrel porin [Algoriphagus aquaeductus]|uniref:Putative beta-barrel porin n=2 Tax=Algoriphagus aquaeductus TaxID=475299 RepID=A0A326RNL6_9BACT|nr:putative beta-barrel porin [Algoriphagus aquaeductus]
MLAFQPLFAQRPIPQVNSGANQGPRQGRQLADPEEEDAEGRRTLLDDSTKQVYGPKTTLYFFEKAIKRNNLKLYEQDTLLDNFHNYDPVAKSGWKYQDLGNIGSAAKPMYYSVPEVIGVTSGFHAYDLYFRDPSKRKFFDTKSPFTEMSAFFGGGNRNMLDVAFARNVNPRWNIGLDFNTLRIRKTLNPAQRDDHMTVQNAYGLHTNYRSENGRYWLLAAFSRMKHVVNEIGGIIPPEVDPNSLYFTYEDAKVWLQNTRARDLRQDFHLYHEYKLGNGLQFYHVFDRKNQNLVVESLLDTPDALFFNSNRFNNPDTTQNKNDFEEWRNEFGLKGTFKGFYYNSFMKLRNGRMESPFFPNKRSAFNEFYIGGELIGKISEKWEVSADGEYLIPGNFKIHGIFISPWLDVEYTKALYKPTSMQQIYYGNHFQWENNFSDIGVDQVRGSIKVDLENLRLRPSLTLNRVNNYIYFGEDQLVAQASGEAFMIMPGFAANFRLGKKFRLDAEVIFTQVSGEAADQFRIPKWYGNTRFYFDSPLFNENVFVQLGVDVRYKSSFFAEAYNPSYQQFYLQNTFNVYGYPVADIFLDFRINRTRVLFKYNHLNAGMMSNEGYFVTPDYTGYRSFLDLGITWYLFD